MADKNARAAEKIADFYIYIIGCNIRCRNPLRIANAFLLQHVLVLRQF